MYDIPKEVLLYISTFLKKKKCLYCGNNLLYAKEKKIICSLKCYINYHINLYTNYLSNIYDNLLHFIVRDEGEWWV